MFGHADMLIMDIQYHRYMALRLPLTLAAVTGMAITCSSSLLGTRVPEKGPPVVPAEMEE